MLAAKATRSWFDGLRVLPADFLSPYLHYFLHPWSVRWRPIRFERMATVLITGSEHVPIAKCFSAGTVAAAKEHNDTYRYLSPALLEMF